MTHSLYRKTIVSYIFLFARRFYSYQFMTLSTVPTRTTTHSTTYFDRANKRVISNDILILHTCIFFACQLTNKQIHCAPDKDCMKREHPRRLTRPPARYCQSPTLPGPSSSQLRTNAPPSHIIERQSSRLECLPDYSRRLSIDECRQNNSAVTSDIRSVNPNPNVQLICPKSNTK